MKGLLVKDIAIMKSRGKILLFLLVWGFVMLAVMDDPSFVVGWIVMIASITSLSTITYDEYDNGMQFLMSLPVTRKGYVLEKYLFSFLSGIVFWLLSIVIVIIGSLVSGKSAALAELPATVPAIAAMMIIIAFSIPPQIKWGAERGRIVLLIIFGVIFVGAFLLSRLADGGGEIIASLEGISLPLVILVAFAFSIVLTVISILISVKVMEKKEF